MDRFFTFFLWFAVLGIVLPVGIGAAQGYARGWPQSWRSADWSSARLLPDAGSTPEAQVLVLAARTGGWKSIFAEHMSIVLKAEGAPAWTRYDVVGWGEPVRRDAFAADARWYGNEPRVIYRLGGAQAAGLIPAIERSIASYPNRARGSYTVWPGPNSNSFVAWVVRHTPGFATELSPTAVGKDWLGPGISFAPAPSKTGYSFGIAGVLGGTLAWREGFEIHLLGATIGFDPQDLAVKLPAVGTFSLRGGG